MHVESEGPGVFGELLQAAGADVRVARLHRGDALPDAGRARRRALDGRADERLRGGAYPFLRDETRFLQAAAARGLPVLGICLGAQMIAKAAGAAVTKNRVEEVGWSTVALTDEGVADPLFRDLPAVAAGLPVARGHLRGSRRRARCSPPAATATTRPSASRRSYGLQFHLEADRALLAEWFAGKAGRSRHPAPLRQARPRGRPLRARPLRELPRDRPAPGRLTRAAGAAAADAAHRRVITYPTRSASRQDQDQEDGNGERLSAGGPGGRSLIDGQTPRSNCGVGFVARLDGVPRHEVVEHGRARAREPRAPRRGRRRQDHRRRRRPAAAAPRPLPARRGRAARHRPARRRRVRRRHGLSPPRRRDGRPLRAS